jgi:uncharacterized protein (DUF488 family)
MTVYTIGHSNRSIEEFMELLEGQGIRLLLDVRRYPGSRLYPHFGKDALSAALQSRQIHYLHLPELGGRRHARQDSVNTAWRNAGFRGYADYMTSPEFREAFDQLMQDAEATTSAIMCAEAVPWQCHRNLLSDALVARGHEVIHILGRTQTQPHVLNETANVAPDGTVTYPGGDDQQQLI